MKTFINTLWLLVLSVSLSACASNDIRWTEEVKLSDGKIIQLQRHVELTDSGFPVQRRGFNKFFEICYPQMNIHWKSKGGYQPDIFDIVDGKAYMHVPISDCFQCKLNDYPETDALYFRWESGKWQRIKHEEFPADSEWNLEMGFKAAPGHEKDDAHGLVTLADKERPSSLRTDQKRNGWKRVNEQNPGIGRCNACRGIGISIYGNDQSPNIFANDGGIACR